MGRPREFDDTAAVHAAMEVFWRKGYEATTTQDLCESTGLGRGSLYNAFGSKRQLYEAALRRYSVIGPQGQLEILERPGSVKDRLRALMVWCVDVDMADPERRGCLAINAAMDASGRTSEIAELAHKQFVRLEQTICHMMAVGQSSGELSSERSPLQAARFFQSAYYGLRVLGKVTDDRAALLDVIEGTLSAL
ncbi:TetR/AcrR family transcriptional regulator [Allokutzneria multivorans]|uniref:TetR/AcrR family transcriptional regulator n=1 Tax=Allokutzneria multivorans TaxID=1142134 RepID=A0ABP7T4W2_9PSEU